MKTTSVKLILCFLFLTIFTCCDKLQSETEPELVLRNFDELASSDAVTPEGGDFVLEFYASLPWSVAVTSDNPDWISMSPARGDAGENSITVRTESNLSGKSRSASVRISCGSFSETFYVTQEAIPETEDVFEVSPETVGISYKGGKISVAIKTNLDYTIDVKDEWIMLQTTGLVQEGNLEFEVEANPLNEGRTGTISFVAGEYSANVTVIQEAAPEEDYFWISPTYFDVPASGGNVTVNISTNMDYTLDIVDSEWITLISGSGVKEGELVFKVAENIEETDRTGIIMLCAGTNCYNVTVVQAGHEYEGPSGGNEDVGNDDEHNW